MPFIPEDGNKISPSHTLFAEKIVLKLGKTIQNVLGVTLLMQASIVTNYVNILKYFIFKNQ